MRPGRKVLAVAAVVTFLAGVLLSFPARVAYHWFVPAGVALSGVEGSAWSGSALEMAVGGFYLRDVSWRLRPLHLLTGKLALDVEASPASGFVESRVALGINGSVTLTELRAATGLRSLQSILNMQGLSGNASAEFERLQIRDNAPVAADGVVTIVDLVAPLVDRRSLGDFRAEFETTDEGIVAAFEDTDAVFDLAGSLTLYPDRRYRLDGKIAPTERTSAKLRDQMRFIPRDPQGRHDLRFEGVL